MLAFIESYHEALLSIVLVDRADPFCSAAGQHFNQLLGRFGSPVVILNLVKVGDQHLLIIIIIIVTPSVARTFINWRP